MKQLYMLGLGGQVPGANIEVHDIQFVVATSVEECYPAILTRWYGTTLHLDSFTVIRCINDYEVVIGGADCNRLYLVVYGGYDPTIFDEIHRYHFVLASSPQEAKRQGKTDMIQFNHIDHIDEVVDVAHNCGVSLGFKESSSQETDNQTIHNYVKLR